ncbi:MAG: fumarylacetoacetate hydrolase family protein [Paracoccaceae bacterium]
MIIGKRATRIAVDDAMSRLRLFGDQRHLGARQPPRRAVDFLQGSGQLLSSQLAIVTADEVPDFSQSGALADQERRRETARSNTKFMLFRTPELIADLSSGITLEPGDIIATGTPAGVGAGREPQEWMWPGDVIECGVEGVGVLRNPVVKIGN